MSSKRFKPIVLTLLFFVAEAIPASLLGKVDFPVSCTPAAQVKFERGLALLHHMMYLQAEKQFAAAGESDPECAMAHWGVAMTIFHPLWQDRPGPDDLKKGQASLDRALALNPPTERERAYIEAGGAFYRDWKNLEPKARLKAWESAQERLYRAYPSDNDAVAFYALAMLATASKTDKAFLKQKQAGKILEGLNTRAPQHPAGFHYLIHAYDNPLLAERALAVARGYDKIAPEVPHALHMPSHIFVRLGLWEDAAVWNKRSAAAALRQSEPGKTSRHYAHAMDYLVYAYLQLARDSKAKQSVDRLRRIDNHEDTFTAAYGLAAAQARYPLERGQWAEAAALKPRIPAAFPWEKYPEAESIIHFARGLGAARTGDAAAARNALAELNRLYRTISENSKRPEWAVHADAQRKAVSAWITFSEGDREMALDKMKTAADLEDSVDKHPVTPGHVLPMRELLGDMRLMADQPLAAIDAYEISLTNAPNRLRSLYGAGQAAKLAGNSEKARKYFGQITGIAESERKELAEIVTF